MLTPYNPFVRSILPNPNPIDRFNFRRTIDQTPDPTIPVNTQPTFEDEYRKLLGPTPNRLAYQNFAMEDAPVVQPTKMNRLAAILSGSSAAFSGNPGMSASITDRIMNQGQAEADKIHEEKLARLAQSANFDQRDTESKLKGLEYLHNDIWKQNEDKRQNQAMDYEGQRLGNESRLADSSIKNTNENIAWRTSPFNPDNNVTLTNPDTGETELKGLFSGQSRPLGKGKPSFKDEAVQAGKKAAAVSAAEQGGKEALVRLAGDQRLEVANANNRAKLDAVKAKLGNEMSKFNSKTAEYEQRARLSAAINDPNNAEFVNAMDYIIEDPNTHLLSVKPDQSWFGSEDPKITELKRKLQQILATPDMPGKTSSNNQPVTNQPVTTRPGWGAPIIK